MSFYALPPLPGPNRSAHRPHRGARDARGPGWDGHVRGILVTILFHWAKGAAHEAAASGSQLAKITRGKGFSVRKTRAKRKAEHSMAFLCVLSIEL
jgi:hypothetical protein